MLTRVRAVLRPSFDVLRVLRPVDRRRLRLLVVLQLASSVLDTVSVVLFVPLLGAIRGDDGSTDAWISRLAGREASSQQAIQRISAMVALVLVGKTLIGVLLARRQSSDLARAEANLRARVLGGLLRRPWSELRKVPPAKIVDTCTTQTAIVFDELLNPTLLLITDLLTAAGAIAPLFFLYPIAAGAMVAYCVVLTVVYGRVVLPMVGRNARRLYAAEIDAMRTLTGVTGVLKSLRLNGSRSHVVQRFRGDSLEAAQARARHRFTLALPRHYFEATITIGLLLLLTLLAALDDDQALTAVGLFGAVAFRLTPSLTRLLALLTMMRRGGHAAGMVLQHVALDTDDTSGTTPARRGTLALDRVSFTYEPDSEPVVRDLSLTIAPGDWIGIRGPSGAGKSTLLDLVLGLLEPTSGTITFDGARLEEDTLRAWQAGIGYVPQDVVLVDDTVRRNLVLGLPDDRCTDDRLREVLRQVRLLDDVLRLPEGLDTVLGADRALSGGQRKRIGIARALLVDPQVLVLDEADAGLDLETDRAILQTIAELQPRPAILMISHRPEGFAHCTKVVDLPGGTPSVR